MANNKPQASEPPITITPVEDFNAIWKSMTSINLVDGLLDPHDVDMNMFIGNMKRLVDHMYVVTTRIGYLRGLVIGGIGANTSDLIISQRDNIPEKPLEFKRSVVNMPSQLLRSIIDPLAVEELKGLFKDWVEMHNVMDKFWRNAEAWVETLEKKLVEEKLDPPAVPKKAPDASKPVPGRSYSATDADKFWKDTTKTVNPQATKPTMAQSFNGDGAANSGPLSTKNISDVMRQAATADFPRIYKSNASAKSC